MLTTALTTLLLSAITVQAALQVTLQQLTTNVVRVVVTNPDAQDVTLLKDPNSILSPEWATEKFNFASVDGSHVAPTFSGVLVKWSPEIAKQSDSGLVTIPGGKSVNFDHDLAQSYSFDNNLQQFSITPVQQSLMASTADAPVSLSVSALTVTINVLLDLNAIKRSTGAGPNRLRSGTSFDGCSSSQEGQINQAVADAQLLATAATADLSVIKTGTPRYTTWFGTFNSARHNAVRSHFQKISNGQLISDHFDCSICPKDPKNNSVFAYVYPDQPGKGIFLCSAFWRANATGTDSKAGTLIHESSHFDKNGGTRDRAYGQADCKKLATSDPAGATMNADSTEYFAENTPLMA